MVDLTLFKSLVASGNSDLILSAFVFGYSRICIASGES